mmetsp:Transcript_1547/g.3748  ORF Transcript_1547/g.3748 Transcript_1547/m.3748 type:complete len:234 (-) Transcript_1547:89-790(-)
MGDALLDAVEEAVALEREARGHVDLLPCTHRRGRRQLERLDHVDDDEGVLLRLEALELLLPSDERGALALEEVHHTRHRQAAARTDHVRVHRQGLAAAAPALWREEDARLALQRLDAPGLPRVGRARTREAGRAAHDVRAQAQVGGLLVLLRHEPLVQQRVLTLHRLALRARRDHRRRPDVDRVVPADAAHVLRQRHPAQDGAARLRAQARVCRALVVAQVVAVEQHVVRVDL